MGWQESENSLKTEGGMALPNLKKYFYAAQIRPLIWCNDDYIEMEGYRNERSRLQDSKFNNTQI